MKKLYLISLLLSAITLHAQVPPEATLLVFGTGQNKEEAIENALYNSIEQTWKSFVSTNTATLDTLQKDGLTRKSTEIIKSFSELATVERSGDNISATLRVIVAIDKVLKFAESTHTPIELITTEFNSNMRLIGLHRHNSIVAIDSLLLVLKDVSSSMFDYNFRASAPIAVENGYKFSGVVEVTVNEQAKAFYNLICITYNALQADCFVPAQNGTMKKAWISQNRNKFEYNPKFRTSCLGNYEFKEDYVRGEQHAYFVGIPYTIFMLENMAIKNCRVTTNTGIPLIYNVENDQWIWRSGNDISHLQSAEKARLGCDIIYVKSDDPNGISIPTCEIGDIISIYRVEQIIDMDQSMAISSFSCSRTSGTINIKINLYSDYDVKEINTKYSNRIVIGQTI